MPQDDSKRITVYVPDNTYDELMAIADKSGVKPSHFFAMALVRGAREMSQDLVPPTVQDVFKDPELLGAIFAVVQEQGFAGHGPLTKAMEAVRAILLPPERQ